MQKWAYGFVAIAATAFSSLAAQADTFSTFTLSGVTVSGNPSLSVTGTVTIDSPSGGGATFSDLNVVVSGSGSTLNFSGIGNQGQFNANTHDPTKEVVYLDTYLFVGQQLAELQLSILGYTFQTLPAYGGGPLCTLDNSCTAAGDFRFTGSLVIPDGSTIEDFQSGSLVMEAPTSATPEPGTFALLGTGLVGVWGAARRRM